MVPTDCINLTDYYFENGFRKVYPYYFIYGSWAKERWVGSRIIDAYEKEFGSNFNRGTLETLFEKGTIRVNYCRVKKDYVIKANDFLQNRLHRHELPVLGLPIKVIHESDDFVVVDKPPSVPVSADPLTV